MGMGSKIKDLLKEVEGEVERRQRDEIRTGRMMVLEREQRRMRTECRR